MTALAKNLKNDLTLRAEQENVYSKKLLSWFAEQPKSQISYDEFQFSGKTIHRFFADLTGAKMLGGFGRSQNKLTAALKGCLKLLKEKYIKNA